MNCFLCHRLKCNLWKLQWVITCVVVNFRQKKHTYVFPNPEHLFLYPKYVWLKRLRSSGYPKLWDPIRVNEINNLYPRVRSYWSIPVPGWYDHCGTQEPVNLIFSQKNHNFSLQTNMFLESREREKREGGGEEPDPHLGLNYWAFDTWSSTKLVSQILSRTVLELRSVTARREE